MLRLYSGPLSMYGMKAEIALREKALAFELVMVPFTADHRYEPKHSEVVRINPKGQVPVLIGDGLELFDSTQIFEYLEELKPAPPLWPSERRARAEARLLELKSDEVFFPPIIRLMSLQDAPGDPAAAAAREAASNFYDQLEAKFAGEGRDFLAGPYTYADIAFFMAQIYAHRMGAPMGAHPRLRTWRERVAHRPAVEIVMRRLTGFLAEHKRTVPDFLAHLT